MDTFFGRNRFSKIFAAALGSALLLSAGRVSAGTRMIPPPPPRHADDTSVDGIRQESVWGVNPGENRFDTLRDDEGEEIDFNRGTLSRRSANRAPAGLEVSPKKGKAADDGWKSSPNDDGRVVTKEATTSTGERPVLKRVTKTAVERQNAEVEKFVTEVSDPIARRKGVQEVSIIAGDLGFFPKTIFVSRDVPVRLFVTGASKGSLCIMMDSFNVRKQVRSNKIEEITFVPNQPGTYRFYCPVNGSEGTMVVKELTTATPGEG
ncbi:MAG: cupredoxin domain-containing protein [Bdellovibrionales bacterium]|nr:cupredoxin domain-containing protein [Bdellovibrionales bacterium]